MGAHRVIQPEHTPQQIRRQKSIPEPHIFPVNEIRHQPRELQSDLNGKGHKDQPSYRGIKQSK